MRNIPLGPSDVTSLEREHMNVSHTAMYFQGADWQARDQKANALPAAISIFATLGLTAGALALWPALRTLGLLPVVLSGCVVGPLVARWALGRFDTFDPRAIAGLAAYYLYFIAPMLHIATDYWMTNVRGPDSWSDLVLSASWLNLLGLIAFRFTIGLTCKTRLRTDAGSHQGGGAYIHTFTRNRLIPILLTLIAISSGAFALTVISFGGPRAYFSALSAKSGLEDMGLIFLVAEASPTLILLLLVLGTRRSPGATRSWSVASLLCLFFVLQLFAGGLRGSRANIVWPMLGAVAIIHIYLYKFSRRSVVVMVALLLVFSFVYAQYKSLQGDVFGAASSADSLMDLREETGRDWNSVLLGDFSRADVQAWVMADSPAGEYPRPRGGTYIGGAAVMIPRALWPERPPTKVKAGTDFRYGVGSYEAGLRSSRIYGLGGEAALNFGPIGVPVALAVYGALVGAAATLWLRWTAATRDARGVIAAALPMLTALALVSDSDNVTFAALKHGAIFALIYHLASRRVEESHAPRVSEVNPL